jgi:hypothetical protein
MKQLVLSLAVLSGCAHHPYLTAAAVNSAVVIGAGACALECNGTARGAAEGVLIGELAVTAFFTAMIVEALEKVMQ